MLPPDVTDWLAADQHPGAEAWVREHQDETRAVLQALGIDPASEIGYFYLHFSPDAVRGWYELHEADGIAEETAFAREELGIPDRFLALTSTEGDGIVLYDRGTGEVFDVEFGRFERLAAGTLPPIARSFADYLRWCRARHEEDA